MNYQQFVTLVLSCERFGETETLATLDPRLQALIEVSPLATTTNTLQLLNNAVACLEIGEVYCEVGCHQGVHLIGALFHQPTAMAYAVDDFDQRDPFSDSLDILSERLEAFEMTEQVFFCHQGLEAFFCDLQAVQPEEKIGVFFFDGSPDYRSHLMSLLLVRPFLAEQALLIVRHGDWQTVGQAHQDFIAAHPQCQMLFDFATPEHSSQWQGLRVLQWDAQSSHLWPWEDWQSIQDTDALQSIASLTRPNRLTFVKTLENQANQAIKAGLFSEAEARYRSLLTWEPNYLSAWYNLSALLFQSRRYDQALTVVSKAIDLAPDQANYYYLLGNILEKLNKRGKAITAYQKVIDLDPTLIDAYNSLGNIYSQTSCFPEAEDIYRQALTIDSNHIGAYINLGNLLRKQYQTDAAAELYHAALKIQPENPDIIFNLMLTYSYSGDTEAAIAQACEGLKLLPNDFSFLLHSKMIFPVIYTNSEQIHEFRERFKSGLQEIIDQTNLSDVEIAQSAFQGICDWNQNFFLPYQGLDDTALQLQYGQFIHQVLTANFPEWMKPRRMPVLAGNKKIRVGYLSTLFYNHSGTRWALGWLENHDPEKFDRYCYYVGDRVDDITEVFRKSSDFFCQLPLDFEAICNQVLADQLHILVFPDVGMDSKAMVLSGLRLAPIQCTAWGHPLTSGLPNIDYYLSGELMEPPSAQSHYTEQLVLLPNLGFSYARPQLSWSSKTRADFHLPEEVTLFISYQSLFKYLPQHDYVFAEILKQVPHSLLIFVEDANSKVTTQFRERMTLSFARFGLDFEQSCRILHRQSIENYFSLLSVADIALDALSFSGGNTCFDAIACNLPVVTIAGEFMRSRLATGILTFLGMTETIARTETEYIEIAIRLGVDLRLRQAIVTQIETQKDHIYNDLKCVEGLEAFFQTSVQERLAQQSQQLQLLWAAAKDAQHQGNWHQAITSLEIILQENVLETEAWQDLGVAQYSLGQYQAAYQSISQAIELNPEMGRYYHVLGVILEALKQGAEAIQAQETAIRLDPSLANSYNNLGLLYVANRRYEDAEAIYQQAIQVCPDHYWAYINLYDLFKSCDRISEALAIADQGIQRFPENIALKHAKYLILPTLYRSEAEIQNYRAAFQTGLTQFLQEIPLDTETQRRQTWFDIARCHNFLLTYQGQNDRELQQQYGELVHRIVAANYPEWVQTRTMPPLQEGERIRVGYVSHCFHTHSVGKLTLGWFRHASHDRFELYCYHQGITQDGITQAFQAFSDHYYYLQDPEAVCRQILADRLHILVFTDIGMHPATTVVAAARLAPVQCVFWGHPVTTGLPTIDYFLSSALMEPENGQDHYTETLVPLPNLGIVYEWPQLPTQTQPRLAFLSPHDTGKIVTEASILYLSCQSLFKYLPQYDYIFATIAQQVPNARFLFLSWLPPAITDKFQQRLELAFSQVGLRAEDFCLILPSLNKDDYLNLNQISDVYLDALAWSGGNTTFDAIACGLPIVTCPGEFMRGRHTYGILEMLGITETIAGDEQSYIQMAVRMGRDSSWREHIAQAICQNRYKLQSDPVCMRELEAFYTRLVRQA